jgi:uncharacterized protein involved in type VI secretion and phage assembly
MSNNRANTPKFFFEPAQRSLKSEFRLLGFSGVEGLSQMMRFHLQLKAKDPDVEFAQLLDQPAALIIATGDDEAPEHKYHGMVARVEQAGRGVEAVEYLVELVPRLWRLTLNHRSRIFQNQSAPDIVEKILKERASIRYANIARNTGKRISPSSRACWKKRAFSISSSTPTARKCWSWPTLLPRIPKPRRSKNCPSASPAA